MTATVITAALTGVLATRDHCPAIPYTPKEIGEEAKRAADAGAAIVHIHARTPDGAPDWRVETFAEIFAEVRARSDVIVNFSTGAVGVPREERIEHISELRPEMAALNMGSMNYAIYSAKRKAFVHDHVFANPFKDIQFFLEAMNHAAVRPEMECFDAGHIGNTRPFIDMGVLKPPYQFSLIMGVLGGIPGTTRHLVDQVDSLPAGSHWQVIGIGLDQWEATSGSVWRTTSTWRRGGWRKAMATWSRRRPRCAGISAATWPPCRRPGRSSDWNPLRARRQTSAGREDPHDRDQS